MKRKYANRIILILFLFVGSLNHLQSQIVVKGTVSDQETTLPGVNVSVKDTNISTVTDKEGKYIIVLPKNHYELNFSYVGFITETVLINETDGREQTVSVSLVMDLIELSEIVVIGYGTVKKKDLTGSVAVVTQEELTRIPSPDVQRAMQGKASGVLVFQTGEPGGGNDGEGINIRVRGIGSITEDPDPLIVVDGIAGADINTISPQDIESISVLKDASSSAIYGANGSNGVIVITTKRGSKSDKPKVTFNANISTSQRTNPFNVMNADEYAKFYNEVYELRNLVPPAAYSDNFRQQYYDGDWHNGTDWQDEILQDNISQKYYFNISHGNDKSNYSLSFNFYDEQGMLLKSASSMYNLRANSDFQINKYVKIGESLNLSRRIQNDPDNNAWGMSIESTPLMNIYNPDNKEGYEGTQIPFNYLTESGEIGTALNTGGNDKYNPVGILSIPDKNKILDNVLADVYIEIKPLKGLTYKCSGSVQAYYKETHDWSPSYEMGVRRSTSTSLYQSNFRGQTFQLKNQLSYSLTLQQHFFDITAVHDGSISSNRGITGSSSDFPYEQVPVIDYGKLKDLQGSEGEGSSLSYLGRLSYNYDSKYLLTASIRYDGSPNFADGRRWGHFPAFSVAWKLNEDFLKEVEQINMLKLRFGWGKTGNADIGGFKYQTRIGTPDYFRPVFGLESTQAYALNEDVWSDPGNPYITWEAANMTNFGLDLNAFRNKIQLTVEYYIKKSDFLLLDVPVSLIHGKGINWNPGTVKYNLGSVENKGFEFDIRYTKQEGTFNYNIFANLTTVKNVVTDIPSQILAGNNITMEGESIGSIYAFKAERIIQESDFDEAGNYLYPEPAQGTPSPGDLMFADISGPDGIPDSAITDDDRTIVGKPIPDFTYSFGFECYYKSFDMSVFFYGVQNVDILNNMRSKVECFRTQDMDHNKSADWAAHYYGKDGQPSTKYIRADKDDSNFNSRVSSWWVDDASFLRIKDLQIGYTIPKSILKHVGISSTRIYLSAMNLYTFTKYEGYDPESPLNENNPLEPGIDENKYPIPRVFSAGIQISL